MQWTGTDERSSKEGRERTMLNCAIKNQENQEEEQHSGYTCVIIIRWYICTHQLTTTALKSAELYNKKISD